MIKAVVAALTILLFSGCTTRPEKHFSHVRPSAEFASVSVSEGQVEAVFRAVLPDGGYVLATEGVRVQGRRILIAPVYSKDLDAKLSWSTTVVDVELVVQVPVSEAGEYVVSIARSDGSERTWNVVVP